ncbi:MAG: hypothetical protein OEW90_00945 [Betaproteobacteria bacterium]|nr:hypothetical protein [Betaproteobacteria bacterium]
MPGIAYHNLVATTPDDPLYELRPSHWNDSHPVSLTVVGSEVIGAFKNDGGVSFGLDTDGKITAAAPAGGGGITNINVSAGTTSQNLSRLTFDNLNGISFGLNGSVITGSHNGLTALPVHDSAGHSGNIIPNAVQDFGNNAISIGTAGVPAASAGRIILYGFNEQGKTRLGMVTPDGSQITHAQDQFIIARNTSGGAIAAGKAVYVTGSTGQTPNISPAKADAGSTMPAIGVTVDAISNNGFGRVMVGGVADGLDTSSFTEGDRLWVSAVTAGDLTATEPAYPNLRQRVAIVINAHATQGKLLVLVAGARGEFGIQAISAGTTQFTSGAAVFGNLNGISFGVDGNTVTASHNGITSQTNQTLGGYALGNTVGQSSSSTFDARSFSVSGMGVASMGWSNGALIVSVPSGGGGITNINVSAGTTSQNLSKFEFNNANGVSFGLNGSTVTASHNGLTSQSNQAASAANGSFTFQTLGFLNSNGVSFQTTTGSQIVASHNGLTSQSNQAFSAAGGSSAFQTLSFNNANGFTFSNVGGAVQGSYSVPVVSNAIQAVGSASGSGTNTSRFAADDHVHPGVFSFGVSTLGNTGGNTRVDVGRFVLQGQNGVTLNQSTAAGALNTIGFSVNTNYAASDHSHGNPTLNLTNLSGTTASNSAGFTLSLSANAPGAAAENNWHHLLGANTAGNTTASGSTIGLSGLNLTLSGTNGSQIVISAPATSSLSAITNITIGTTGSTIGFSVAAGGGGAPVDRWIRLPIMTQAGSTQHNTSASIFPFNIGGNLAISNARFGMSIGGATTTNTSSAGFMVSISMVLYTRNGSTLSSVNSGSNTFSGFHQSNSTASMFGARALTVNFASATTLVPDEYWMAVHVRTTTSGQISLAKSLSMAVLPSLASAMAGLDPFGAATTNTRGAMVGLGIFSTSVTRASIAFSDLTGQAGNSATLANLWVDLRNWSVW